LAKELPAGHVKGTCNPKQKTYGGLTLASLKFAVVGPVNAGLQRKSVLRKLLRLANLPDDLADRASDIWFERGRSLRLIGS